MSPNRAERVEKLATGIEGLDLIGEGGIPKGRTTLVTGTAGSAKTVLAAQFLASGIETAGQSGVFVTFEESPDDIRLNMQSLGWPIAEWESAGKWIFVDGSPQPQETILAGGFDLSALMARVQHSIRKVGASRVSLDSLGANSLMPPPSAGNSSALPQRSRKWASPLS